MTDMGWQQGESGDSMESFPKVHDTAAWHYLCFGTKLNVEGEIETASSPPPADDVTTRSQTPFGVLPDEGNILVAEDVGNQEVPCIGAPMVHPEHHLGGPSGHTSSVESLVTRWGAALPPSLRLLRRLDEVSRACLLRMHIGWIMNLKELAKDRACWLFAVAVIVDRPLDANTSSALATLFRKCSELKSTVTTREDPIIAMLDILLSIAGSYFGQRATSIGS